MNVYALGASKNIGYFAALRLLAQGATITFLLRSLSVFDNDSAIQGYVASGHAHLVQGDAMSAESVRKGWQKATEINGGAVDLVLFTVGGIPSFTLTKGFVLNPPNLCTRSLLNVLTTMPASLREPAGQPRFVVLSSIGLTRASHKALPLALKPLYGILLQGPHEDKLGIECILAHCAGREWTDEEPDRKVLPDGWQSEAGVPASGELKHVVVVRPALLTDGECKADGASKPPYRVADRDLGNGYRVSRRDVAAFIVNGLLQDWDHWEGKCISIAY